MTGKLSNRMECIAKMVTPGRTVADIGTDHGFVPIYLVKEGICPKAYAMDVNEGPLEHARAHIEENGLSDRIETRLSDGLAALKPGEANAIIIAGMGGMLMKKIIKEGLGTVYSAKELILAPQSDLKDFRAFLRAQTLGIVDEELVLEDGKYYWIFKCIPHRGSIPKNIPAEVSERYGEILFERKSETLKKHLLEQRDKLTAIYEEMKDKIVDTERMDSVLAELEATRRGLELLEA